MNAEVVAVPRARRGRSAAALLRGLRRRPIPRSERDALVEQLFVLFGDTDPTVFGPAMEAAANEGAALEKEVAAALIGRLASLGANPDLPQANHALHALRKLEDNLGPHPPR
jgi:hypothetical protein